MGWNVARVLVVCAALTGACMDTSSTGPRVVVIRGKVATGAHVRAPLAGAYVGILGPQGPNAGHWIRYVSSSSSGLATETTTAADGSYSYTVEVDAVTATTKGFPYFI